MKVEAVLTNPTGQSVTVPLTWTLYSWSGNDPNNAIGTRTEQVTIPAGGQKLVSYTVSDSQYPVYLLTGSAKWHDASSIINVRFVREGKNRIRINFPAVTSYPLTAGAPATLFSCLHNAGTSDVVPGSRLVLSLRDAAGDLIHSYTYEGGVSGAMMGVAEDFTPKKDVRHIHARRAALPGPKPRGPEPCLVRLPQTKSVRMREYGGRRRRLAGPAYIHSRNSRLAPRRRRAHISCGMEPQVGKGKVTRLRNSVIVSHSELQ